MDQIKTKSRHLDMTTPDGVCDAYLTFPNDNSPHPAVVLLMDGFGPRRYLWELADKIAEHGFYVLVPNLFYRLKRAPMVDMPFPITMEELPLARGMFVPLMQKFTPDDTIKDMKTFLSFLDEQKEVKKGKVGLTGYCLGGSLALRLAAAYPERVGAAASFHGGNLATAQANSPHLLLAKIQAALYIAHADNDAHMTEEQIQTLQEALSATTLRYEMEKYKDAIHGFTMADLPPFSEKYIARHWEKLIPLFKNNL